MVNYFKFTLLAWFVIILWASGCRNHQKEDKKFRWDSDGMMVIDGKRTFIIGSYHLPKTDNSYKTLSANGYNLIHTQEDIKALDQANANGLKAWISVGFINEKTIKTDTARISSIINQYKEHAALLFWELVDEPAFNWNKAAVRIPPGPLIDTYKFIKTLDAEHPVYTNHGPVNLISTLQKYNPSTDVVACDIYPVIPQGIRPTYALYPDGQQGDLLNTYISQVGEYADKMKKVVYHSRPLFMVLQAFAWEMLKPEVERDPTMILYPTYEQSRFMAYNAIVHGANGVIYWGTNYTPQPSAFMDDLNKVTRELSEMNEVLTAESIFPDIVKTYHELRYSVDTGVEILARQVGGDVYLLTVNSDKTPVRLTLSRLLKYKKAIILNEGRELEIVNGSMTDDYKPFDVHIYKLVE